MTNKPNGGPAFPDVGCINEVHEPGNPGMTLRDYFAAAALPSLFHPHDDIDNPDFRSGVAKEAYQLADAMLAERERDEEV